VSLIFALICMTLTGCAVSRPQIGAVSFVNANGASVQPVSSVSVNGQLYFIATVTNDDELLGVSWTVTCGSAIPPGGASGTANDTACGICNPSQTFSGPIPTYPITGYITTYSAPPTVPAGGTVTITAHATALPSVASSITLTVVAAQAVAEPRSMGKRNAQQAHVGSLGNIFPITSATGVMERAAGSSL
jgi:hypothetical protein